jgi:hypothetical protein
MEGQTMSNSIEQFQEALSKLGNHARAALQAFDEVCIALQGTLEAVWELISSTMQAILEAMQDALAGAVWIIRLKAKYRRNRQYTISMSKSGKLERRHGTYWRLRR